MNFVHGLRLADECDRCLRHSPHLSRSHGHGSHVEYDGGLLHPERLSNRICANKAVSPVMFITLRTAIAQSGPSSPLVKDDSIISIHLSVDPIDSQSTHGHAAARGKRKYSRGYHPHHSITDVHQITGSPFSSYKVESVRISEK